MRDWLHDNDRECARIMSETGKPMSVDEWRAFRQRCLDSGLLRVDVHFVEGAILRMRLGDLVAQVKLTLDGGWKP